MGNLIWSEWGRLLALASATYMAWASLWAFFYRKFFWDMIGGTLGPAGIIPGSNSKPFLAIIVEIPLLQIFTLLIALFTLALEGPLPFVAGTVLHRSLPLRIVLYFLAALIGILVYQTVDCAVYYFITSIVYTKAMVNGERILSDQEKRSSEV